VERLTSKMYVDDGGGRCPVCGSSNIIGSGHDYDGSQIWQNIHCSDCNSEWTDVYELTGYDNLTIRNKSEEVTQNGRK